MNARVLNIFLTVLCAALMIIVAWQYRLLRDRPMEPVATVDHATSLIAGAGSSSSTGEIGERGDPEPLAAADPSPAPIVVPEQPLAEPEIVPAAPRFDWREVESTDYKTYISNLRSIGVPEQTVKDIVVADVSAAYSPERGDAMAERYEGFQYWKSNPEEVEARSAIESRRREIDDSMQGALKQLLGEDTIAPSTTLAWREAELEQQLAFLPTDTRERTAALLLQSADLESQVKGLSEFRRNSGSPEERFRVLEEYEFKRESLFALLSEEEYELVDMNTSWTADNLRRAMVKFQPNEEEFRIIFREWRAHDEDLAERFATGQPDPGNAHVFSNIANQLSPERYKRYRETWWK